MTKDAAQQSNWTFYEAVIIGKKMEDKTPLILEIKGNSLDDGPGIRSVVFFKGCPLSCVWCHNPESKKAVREISFDANVCVGCGTCREICSSNALSPGSPGYIDRDRCDLCFACVDACPSGALARVGLFMSVDDILATVLPDKPFYDSSDGGVTLSGGEPTLYMDFTAQLLQALKGNGIQTLVETCGHFDPDRFMERIYPHTDIIYFDIKLIDQAAHNRYCGISNTTILNNFKRLVHAATRDGKSMLPRTPLIPGITDTDTNIQQIADYLDSLGIKKAALLAYNPLWHEKTDKIGARDPYKNDSTLTTFADQSAMDRCRRIYNNAGITPV
ncbi:MAG: glycyl-radical enzyme activating protein [Thermodesulfobacteriota bacterium]|nr:glycyl-radical enzyme activating protein [Thermodesulfobacteriota bacterium]